MQRRLILFRYLICCGLSLGLSTLALAEPHDVFGTYLTESETSLIEISDCGDGTPCGRIAWISPTELAPGITPQSARTRAGDPLLGLLMLKGFSKKKKDWRGGTIYDPEADKTYAARLKRMSTGELELKGCIGPICQTQIWSHHSQ